MNGKGAEWRFDFIKYPNPKYSRAIKAVNAQVGEPFIHDPSTIALCDGKYYTFGTGEGGIWSEGKSRDGYTLEIVNRLHDRIKTFFKAKEML